jgi:hypothetical protein
LSIDFEYSHYDGKGGGERIIYHANFVAAEDGWHAASAKLGGVTLN